jgi:hypothetical protein
MRRPSRPPATIRRHRFAATDYNTKHACVCPLVRHAPRLPTGRVGTTQRQRITPADGADVPATSARRGGRPTRSEAERLGARILDAAAELFFTVGYGATSIEAVARRIGISKRTFYSRYAAQGGAVQRRRASDDRTDASCRATFRCSKAQRSRKFSNVSRELILRAALSAARACAAPD